MLESRKRLLVVEDEEDIRNLILLQLTRKGYIADEAANGSSALRQLKQNQYHLVMVDWMLPELSGIEIIRTVRCQPGQNQLTPILMVTAKTQSADIVAGLQAGADDYLTKPFELAVLIARVEALIRRGELQNGESLTSSTILQIGRLIVNTDSYEVTCQGVAVQLTLSEFKLLHALIKNQGRVLTRGQLIDLIQGAGIAVIDRTVDTHIFGLRKKLLGCSNLIETVRGVGYRVGNLE